MPISEKELNWNYYKTAGIRRLRRNFLRFGNYLKAFEKQPEPGGRPILM